MQNKIAFEFVKSLRASRTSRRATLDKLGEWIEKNTTINSRPFSFVGHEFQKDIVNDPHTSVVVRKPSQCGLSEVSARQVLALLATAPGLTAIYGLQTVSFSTRFFKSRVDNIISGSKALSELLLPGSDSASFKSFRNGSQLHGAGFSAGIDVISIPAAAMTIDELDFSDSEAVATGESRLSHSPFVDENTGVRGLRRYFSTPTTGGYGVSLMFDKSDRKFRLCKCQHCQHWFWPNLLEQGVIDGFDRPLTELTTTDAVTLDERGLLESARLLCPSCHNPITRDNLQYLYRSWVAEKPENKRVSGWAVSPFDLPDFHTPESLVRKLITIGDSHIEHWHNFALGLPYESALSSVLPDVVKENTILAHVPPEMGAGGCVMGLDVGRTSWAVVGKLMEGNLHILHAEQIKLRTEDGSDLVERVVYLLRAYRCILALGDNLPYTDSILSIMAQCPALKGVEYSLRDKSLPLMVFDEESDVVKMNRTKVLSYMVKRVNSGQVKFAQMPELPILDAHMHAIKQVARTKENGETVQEWVKVGADHYAHALNYCNMAAYHIQNSFVSTFTPPLTIRQVVPGRAFRPLRAA